MSGRGSRQDLTFQYPCSLRFPSWRGEPTEGVNHKLCTGDWYNLTASYTAPPSSKISLPPHRFRDKFFAERTRAEEPSKGCTPPCGEARSIYLKAHTRRKKLLL
jgi:hypothetical protein